MTSLPLKRLLRNESGAVLIEIALAIPFLAMLAIGSFEVGMVVSRQQELQSSLVEGEAIALATNGGAKTDLSNIKDIISESIGLSKSNISLTLEYRCGLDETLVESRESCSEGEDVSEYVNFELTDRHVPIWSKFGFGKPIDLKVDRTVQVS